RWCERPAARPSGSRAWSSTSPTSASTRCGGASWARPTARGWAATSRPWSWSRCGACSSRARRSSWRRPRSCERATAAAAGRRARARGLGVAAPAEGARADPARSPPRRSRGPHAPAVRRARRAEPGAGERAAMNPRSFRYREDRSVATLTLDRPQALNALTFEVYRELTETFVRLAERRDVRVAVITGAGRAFCTGGDVKEIIGELLHRDQQGLADFTRSTCDLVRAMRALPQPIVASLNGTVAGAGAAIALAADLRIAAETARIAFLFVKVGLSGADMGAAHLLPRVVGLGRATEMLLTGEFVDAAEAQRIGLYNRVVSPERLGAGPAEPARRRARGA